MVDVVKRVCLRPYTVEAENGDTFALRWGDIVTTSRDERNGQIFVFSNFWVAVPRECLSDPEPTTQDEVEVLEEKTCYLWAELARLTRDLHLAHEQAQWWEDQTAKYLAILKLQPHDSLCATADGKGIGPCDCWKSEIDK